MGPLVTQKMSFPDRATWLANRRSFGIGSSDAPIILGISRYKSAFQLYREKTGDATESRSETEAMEWGNLLEEPIAQRYAKETGRTVYNPKTTAGEFVLYRSLEYEFMLAQIDRQTTPNDSPDVVPLEIKNAHFFAGKPWLDNQEPPLEFIVQLQHQLAVTGAPWGSMAALIGGCRFVWTDIPRDDVFIEGLIAAEREFWARVLNRTPPDPDGSDKTKAAVDAMFRKESSGIIVPLEPELLDADAEYEAAKVVLKDWTVKKTAAENRLKLAIGENAGGRFPNGKLYTWKSQTRKEFISKETTFRVLRPFAPKSAELPGVRPVLQLEESMDTE